MKPEQTFHDHVQEIRRRVAWLVLVIGVAAIAGYAFRVPIIDFLQRPYGSPLFYTSPAGSFNFVIKIATMVGLVAGLPFIIYHLIRFLEPALPVAIKKSFLAEAILSSCLLALLGMAFGFFVIMPTSLHFFSGFSSNVIKPWISADAYLSYVINVLVTFAVLFQIPLVVLLINRIKPIPPRQMLKYQRHIVVGAFLIAVILPFTYDPISQFVLAVPIIFLYYFSVILVWLANRRKTIPAQVATVKSKPAKAQPVMVTAEDQEPKDEPVAVQPASVLQAAVKVTKPSHSRRTPLKLDALNSVHPGSNLLDLSGQS